MATTPTKPEIELGAGPNAASVPPWPSQPDQFESLRPSETSSDHLRERRPSGGDALQALLAFSAMHQQVRRRRALAMRLKGFETIAPTTEFEAEEQFLLDEVLQLVAERAIAITGADGLGIALAENNEIVLRASAGAVKPDVGARIQRDSAFSGACFRTAQIVRCDDTETDDRVNLSACRRLGARSMVAVPLCGRRRVIGLLEAFSADPFGFNDSDVNSLALLAELILAALKPEDEDRFAESAQVAETQLSALAIAPAAAASFPKPSPEISAAPPAVLQVKTETKPAVVTKPAPVESLPLRLPKVNPAAQRVAADIARLEATPGPETLAGHHPGLISVAVLVMVAALCAGGFWWKLNNAQLAALVVQPQPQQSVTASQPLAQSGASSPTNSSPVATANPSVDSKTDSQPTSSTSTDVNMPASPANGSATPQELTKMPRITGIRHWSSADSSTVVLDLQDQVQYEAHRLNAPDRIYFDLHDTALAPDIDGKTIDVGDSLLARVRVAQPVSGLTRVVLETRGNSNYSVSLEPNPYRLVVQVRKLGADAKSQINLFPEAAETERKKLAIVIPPATREDLQLRARVAKMRIVVDAGHGGWDLGTVGRRGLLEKDLVLEIAQRLGKLLESRLGADVILTRNDDNYIPLDERAGMANQAQADLFVSVHANYSDLPSARGVETYYTNFFSAPSPKDLETRVEDRSKSAISAVLTPTELHEKVEQSRRLAASVQRSLYGTLSAENPGLRDRGVKEASYVVLTETAMPGILAEVSFVSSPTDEQKLRSDGYREQIAEALYKGIARYAAASHGVKTNIAAK
jgi:N-acetylmuramoyl-L-alanine amidase/putative methionine-R-sulfoxide reductase with GAF domain